MFHIIKGPFPPFFRGLLDLLSKALSDNPQNPLCSLALLLCSFLFYFIDTLSLVGQAGLDLLRAGTMGIHHEGSPPSCPLILLFHFTFLQGPYKYPPQNKFPYFVCSTLLECKPHGVGFS